MCAQVVCPRPRRRTMSHHFGGFSDHSYSDNVRATQRANFASILYTSDVDYNI